MVPSSQAGFPVSGGVSPPRSGMVEADRLAVERGSLAGGLLCQRVVTTMLAARGDSTQRIYATTWRAFGTWCTRHECSPSRIPVSRILEFLQDGLDRGLRPNTLRRQVAALSAFLVSGDTPSLGQLPDVKQFLRGARNICPPTVHRFPSWDLTIVLEALTKAPYEPLNRVSLRYLTHKVVFLVAITSARRISEISALSVRSDLCMIHLDRVVLRLDPTFLPKVNSWFHRAQELSLPTFFPNPSSDVERKWHKLDLRRALRTYVKRTRAIRRSEALFVSYHHSSTGSRISPSTVGHWIRATIASAYDYSGQDRPAGIQAHSTRSAATSAAWSARASLEEVCRAATWASPLQFVRHYKVDEFSARDAAFGRRVLLQGTGAGASTLDLPP